MQINNKIQLISSENINANNEVARYQVKSYRAFLLILQQRFEYHVVS